MTIIITGGAGFIGSHLCGKFISMGHKVICVDNFITGSGNNIKEFLSLPDKKFRLIEHDISKPLYLDEYSREIDWVMHFASIASPKHYLSHPIKTLKAGLLGTYNSLGIARSYKAKFFLASTSEVYGDPLVHPQVESYWGNVNTIGERSCYDESKRGAESLTYAYWRQHNLDVRVIRIFNTYGPNMQVDDGRVVSNFIIQALEGKNITVYGDGLQTRSFCYVDDLINGICKVMNCDYQMPINLGNPCEFTIKELADLVLAKIGLASRIVYKSLPSDDPKRRRPDISQAMAILNWHPEIKLEKGLDKTIEYFKECV